MSLLLRSGRSFAATVAIFLCLSTPTGWADAQADTIAELRAQLVALTARLETLEAQQQQTHVAVQANSIEVAETKTLSQSAIASSSVSTPGMARRVGFVFAISLRRSKVPCAR